jgi:general secretion pathway protein J
MKRAGNSGFTLVEMLVSVFIFALISSGAMLALNGSFRAQAQVETAAAHLAEISNARVLIRTDMADLVLRQTRDEFGGFLPYGLQLEADSKLEFTRKGRLNPLGAVPRDDLQRISYIFEDGALIRIVQTQANPAPGNPAQTRYLITGLQSMELSLISKTGEGATMALAARSRSTLPDVLRLQLVFENGDRLEQLFEIAS